VIQSNEVQSRIAILRRKVEDNTATIEDLKEAVALMREGRVSAAASSTTAKRKQAIKEIPHADDMLGELGAL